MGLGVRIGSGDVGVVAGDRPRLRAALEFLRELSEAQGVLEDYVLERLRGLGPALREAAEEARRAGVPVVSLTGVPGVRDFEIRGHVSRILGVGERHRPEVRGDLERIKGAVERGELGLLGLAERLLAGDRGAVKEAAGRLGVDPGVLEVAVFWVSQPVFSALRMLVEPALRGEAWGRGMCPVCGAYTRIAFVDGEGEGWLRCSICGAEWRYPRGKCPFCGNDEAGSIDSYTPMRDERFRLMVCRRCGRYWKLVDESRLRSRVSRWLYDAWSRHLDEVALRLGLK